MIVGLTAENLWSHKQRRSTASCCKLIFLKFSGETQVRNFELNLIEVLFEVELLNVASEVELLVYADVR